MPDEVMKMKGSPDMQFTAFESTIKPGVWYVGDDNYAYLRTEVGVGNSETIARQAAAGLNAIKSRPRPSEEAVEALWQDLLDKDDRTSGADYPDMALITFDEFRDYLSAIPHTGGVKIGTAGRVEYDGFEGDVRGHYVTREGKVGLVLQQFGSRVVHVYREDRVALSGDA